MPIKVQQGPRISVPESSDSDEDILTVTNTKKARSVVEIEEIEEEDHESISRETDAADRDISIQDKISDEQPDTSKLQKSEQFKKVTLKTSFFPLSFFSFA